MLRNNTLLQIYTYYSEISQNIARLWQIYGLYFSFFVSLPQVFNIREYGNLNITELYSFLCHRFGLVPQDYVVHR